MHDRSVRRQTASEQAGLIDIGECESEKQLAAVQLCRLCSKAAHVLPVLLQTMMLSSLNREPLL